MSNIEHISHSIHANQTLNVMCITLLFRALDSKSKFGTFIANQNGGQLMRLLLLTGKASENHQLNGLDDGQKI